MATVMIYGAYGYTGFLICEQAQHTDLAFILAGRNTENLHSLASTLNRPYRTFALSDTPQTIDTALTGVSAVLNCAGPFHRTALPLMQACIRNGAHYLDISAERDSYLHAQNLDDDARRAGVMLMPGCGSSVMLACLAQHVIERMEAPLLSIAIALQVSGPMSRGSVVSVQEADIVRKGEVTGGSSLQATSGAESTTTFDFGDGKGGVECVAARLPEELTIGKLAGVDSESVRTYVRVSGETTFPEGSLDELSSGPGPVERAENPYRAVVEVTASDGHVERAVLHTVNGYTFTSIASVEAAKRVLAGSWVPGFQTAVGVFSSKFVECVEGSVIMHR